MNYGKLAIYQADRDAGMTYSEIAEKHGVSRQYVQQIIGKYNPRHFHPIKEEQCIYPIWRKWMNDNKVYTVELLRRMGHVPAADSVQRYTAYMRGACYPTKGVIDELLAVTGLTYEQLFYEGDGND